MGHACNYGCFVVVHTPESIYDLIATKEELCAWLVYAIKAMIIAGIFRRFESCQFLSA